MKSNQHSSRDMRGDGRTSTSGPIIISLVAHLVFLLIFVITPSLRFERPPARSVINVSMVSLKKPADAKGRKAATAQKRPKVTKPKVIKKVKEPAPEPKKKQPVKKPKKSIKKKDLKSTQAVKKAIEQLEKKMANEKPTPVQPEPLKSALDRLRDKVDKTEAQQDETPALTGGKPGAFSEDGKKTADLIDLYRLEVVFQIQKSWAFNEQLAGGNRSLKAFVVFKVMPDGEIRDIFFTDRSGNDYLDDSAYKAIVKSNPVDPHPRGLVRPYVVVAIGFTPQGIQ